MIEEFDTFAKGRNFLPISTLEDNLDKYPKIQELYSTKPKREARRLLSKAIVASGKYDRYNSGHYCTAAVYVMKDDHT